MLLAIKFLWLYLFSFFVQCWFILIVRLCFHVLFSDSWKLPDFIERFEEGVPNAKGEISSRSTSGPVVMSALKRQCFGNRILCTVYFSLIWVELIYRKGLHCLTLHCPQCFFKINKIQAVLVVWVFINLLISPNFHSHILMNHCI